jgi:hypothetical protein
VLLVEAEATLAQVHSFLLIPYLVETEGYFREIAPGLFHGCDVDQEWDLLSHRQAHQPAGVTGLLDVIIDETALDRIRNSQSMAGQIRHLADSPHAMVRIILAGAVFYEAAATSFDVLPLAGTTDRIGVNYSILGAELASGGDLHDLRARIESTSAASPDHSRAILERHLAALS